MGGWVGGGEGGWEGGRVGGGQAQALPNNFSSVSSVQTSTQHMPAKKQQATGNRQQAKSGVAHASYTMVVLYAVLGIVSSSLVACRRPMSHGPHRSQPPMSPCHHVTMSQAILSGGGVDIVIVVASRRGGRAAGRNTGERRPWTLEAGAGAASRAQNDKRARAERGESGGTQLARAAAKS